MAASWRKCAGAGGPVRLVAAIAFAVAMETADVARLPARTRQVLGVLLLLALALLAVGRSALGTRLDSFTVDEPWHIVAGTSYVRGGDRHLNPEHPPLVKLWVGAAMPKDFRLAREPALREKEQERQWVEDTMFHGNDPLRAQQRARLAMWSLNGGLLLLLGLLLWRAAGIAWAVGTLGFLALEPTMGAHLPVVMTDGPLALTLAPAVVAAGVLAARWRWRWAWVLGITAGLAFSAKHSALAGMVGVAGVLAVAALLGSRHGGVREVARRALQLALAGAVAVLLLWACYGFRFHADANGGDAFNRALPDKIAEVTKPGLRDALSFADRQHLLPRAYLWGLADTLRTGVDGRNIALHLVWGKLHEGRTPWFTWPAILAAKIPLALSALALLGLVLLSWRARLPSTARWMLAALAAASVFHLAALMVSPAAWGGVRHATPLILAAAVLGGGAVAEAWRRRSRALCAAVAALFVAAFAMTIREPRLWEYHNELVGGSTNAWRYFQNEGLDLGQRFAEIREFHDREIAPSGLPMFSDYWMMETQVRAAGLRYRRLVENLQDDNVAGVYDGWFVYPDMARLPVPQFEWDPREVFKDMRMVADLGNVGIWRGRLVRPKARAESMYGKVMDYIYKENGKDWALVAKRLEEVASVSPAMLGAAAELGNAYLRLGDREHAMRAYRRPLEQDKMPVDAALAGRFREQIARVEASADPEQVPLLRNPWLE
jgi:tetratricopeptide (TPR) repeat protein